jgi:acetyl esterase/lipase
MINPPLSALATEDERGLSRVEPLPGGGRLWREVFYDKPLGFRPLTLSLQTPPGPGPAPLVIWVHGGGWQAGHPHIGNASLDAMEIAPNLLAAGFAVAKIAYRLSGEARFPAQLHDCKAAVRFLRENAQTFGLDPTRFAAMGESAGGHLVLMLGVEVPAELEGAGSATSSAVQAVVNWYGVSNFLTLNGQMPPDTILADHDAPDGAVQMLLGQRMQDAPDLARRASPVSHITSQTAPTLTQHGQSDRLVPYGQAVEWHDAMTKAGAYTELHPIPGADHCFCDVDPAPILPRAIAFLKAQLA